MKSLIAIIISILCTSSFAKNCPDLGLSHEELTRKVNTLHRLIKNLNEDISSSNTQIHKLQAAQLIVTTITSAEFASNLALSANPSLSGAAFGVLKDGTKVAIKVMIDREIGITDMTSIASANKVLLMQHPVTDKILNLADIVKFVHDNTVMWTDTRNTTEAIQSSQKSANRLLRKLNTQIETLQRELESIDHCA